MSIELLLLILLNLIGVFVCHSIAKSRGSRHVAFWSAMGALFGPLAIPFLLIFVRGAK